MKLTKFKNKNAITLIALVITIIVLLILAGVALSLVLGEDGITARAIKSKDAYKIAGIEEKANLAYHDSLIGGYVQDGVYHEVTLGDILSTLKTDGDIENYGTTGGSTVTGISLDMESLDLAIGENQTLTVSNTTTSEDGDYYVVIDGKNYLAYLESGKIVIDKDALAESGSTFEIASVETTDSSVAAVEKVGEDQVKITAGARGTATVTVKYTDSIKATLSVTVKQNVTVSVSSEDTSKGTVTELEQDTYLEGSTITLSATPASGYKLDGWYIGETKQTLGTGDVYTVPTDGTSSVDLVAKFIEKPNIAVGSTVTYYPAGATYTWMGKYATIATLSGDTTSYDVELSSNVSGNYRITSWKVLSYDENTGKVELVPASQPSTTVILQGANGYNNAVKLLNDACKTLFVNSSAGITATDVRSIKVEDIENAMTTTAVSNAKGEGYPVSMKNASDTYKGTGYTGNKYYPLIYEKETRGIINGNENSGDDLLNESEQNSLIARDADSLKEFESDGTTPKKGTYGYVNATTSIKPDHTYYSMSLSSSNVKTSAHSTVLCPNSNNYWVASRCVGSGSDSCGFYVRYVNNGCLYTNLLFDSDSSSNSVLYPRAVFPVVSLSSELLESDGGPGYRLISQRSMTQ